MADERDRILKMLEDGAITPDQARELLEAIEAAPADAGPLQQVGDWLRKLSDDPWVVRSAIVVGLVVGAVATLEVLSGAGRQHVPAVLFIRAARLAVLVFWLWMFVDCLVRDPKTLRAKLTRSPDYDKVVWLGLLLVGFFVGQSWGPVAVGLLYFVFGRPTPVGFGPTSVSAPASKGSLEGAGAEERGPGDGAERTTSKTLEEAVPLLGRRPLLLTILAVLSAPVIAASGRSSFPFIIPALLFWLVMLVHCLRRPLASFDGTITSSPRGDKWLWVAVIVLGFALGAVVYYILGWRPSAQPHQSPQAGGSVQDTAAPMAGAEAS